MSFRIRTAAFAPTSACALALMIGTAFTGLPNGATAADLPVTPTQRSTAQQVAQNGVALSELAPNAPDSHTVKRGDTLWDISKIFLKTPWRWPELWGMNLDQIRNPHLIYPGQVLYLDKTGGRARLRLGQNLGSGDTVKLSPHVRSSKLDAGGIPSIPLNLIQPFLNEAVVFDNDSLNSAPRIVAAPDGRVLLTTGDLAYVLGDLSGIREYRIFRNAKPLRDPTTKQVLGYEAAYLGTAQYERPSESRTGDDGKTVLVPATFSVTGMREEIGVGDRLSPVPDKDFANYSPHAPDGAVDGQIISIYGEGFSAGQNQIVALNRGREEGLERGHVLALWRDGRSVIDKTSGKSVNLKLPNERNGLLFVFSVFDHVSYALILSVLDPARPADRFTQP